MAKRISGEAVVKAPEGATRPTERRARPTERRARPAGGSPAGKARTTVATPWGPAEVVEQVSLPQRSGERRFAVVAQLLSTRDGERLVRFAYTTDGVARRGPVTMRARDLERLRAALGRAPVLREVLGM